MVYKFPKFSKALAEDPSTRRIWYGIATAHDFESHDAMTESNESEVGLTQCKDLYYVEIDPVLSGSLANEYEIISKQIFKLREAWSKFSEIRN